MQNSLYLQSEFCKRGRCEKIYRRFSRSPGFPEPAPVFASGDESSTPCPRARRQTRSRTVGEDQMNILLMQ